MIENIAVAYPTDPLAIAGLWTALFLMLAIYSYPLWKENPVYRFAEHIFVATALAIGIVVTLTSLKNTAITPLMGGNYLLIVPILLGFCMYFLLIPKYRWGSRYPIAILVGSSLGLGIASNPLPSIVSQIISTVTPPKAGTAIWAMLPGSPTGDWFSFAFVAIGCVCATMYFLLRYPGEVNANAKEYTRDRLDDLLEWHRRDPVTDYERHRNAEIHRGQGNRNPLIDYPEWADRIDFSLGLGGA